ncbi:hypothetical protein Mycch_3604 [Mycolicibacterium chubuense NBB4]|uniref:Uncharacterized protein n=1 Tax=Mycolicibacterium chubuense (strain NBB4) TaxID=710421 RepID=I4BM30_MYCCN|nr:hypothetical protein [Mycolicibacterium chubuense]AFM18337.1 hypothetical protein Mycch_3604 [Mycolicibacterium chubuense NBB4]
MRTAVVRIGVDPAGELTGAELTTGMTELATLAAEAGARVIANDLAGLPPKRREVEILMTGTEPSALQNAAVELCRRAFPTQPVIGVLTFISHGTDDDARGVLAGFGLTGVIDRRPGGDGWDIITVTLRRADLERIPESRIHTALEASTNCEVRIVLTD